MSTEATTFGVIMSKSSKDIRDLRLSGRRPVVHDALILLQGELVRRDAGRSPSVIPVAISGCPRASAD